MSIEQLSKIRMLPQAHVNYLKNLKESGYEPKVIYDIGSCVLHWTNEARLIWPDAKIILFDAYDPVEFLYRDYDHHMGVLSDCDDKIVKFYQSDIHFAGNSYYKENNDDVFPECNHVMKTTSKLDTIVKNKNFPMPDLVKIDVQGCEMDIIRGGVETLSCASRLIVEMQTADYNRGAPKVHETLPYIESLGWKCVAPLFSNNGPDGDYGFFKLVAEAAEEVL